MNKNMKIIDLLKSLNNTRSKKLCIEFADIKKDCDSYRFYGSYNEAINFTKKNNLENFKVYEHFSINDNLIMIMCDNRWIRRKDFKK